MKKFTFILFSLILILGISQESNAQEYELTGNESQITQATEISLSGSTVDKIYYLFRVDEANEYHCVTFMVGQSYPLNFAPQTLAGKYLVYEFDELKEMPFNFEKFDPKDGILQEGEVIISEANNN